MSPFLPGDRVMAVFSDGRGTAIGTVRRATSLRKPMRDGS